MPFEPGMFHYRDSLLLSAMTLRDVNREVEAEISAFMDMEKTSTEASIDTFDETAFAFADTLEGRKYFRALAKVTSLRNKLSTTHERLEKANTSFKQAQKKARDPKDLQKFIDRIEENNQRINAIVHSLSRALDDLNIAASEFYQACGPHNLE